MNVPGWVWGLTVVGIVGLLTFHFVFYVRKAARGLRHVGSSTSKRVNMSAAGYTATNGPMGQ
jgi:hypothetical protein